MNHKIDSKCLNLLAKTGSRNRLRIPVCATRFSNAIAPKTRVSVEFSPVTLTVEVKPDPKGRYTVEKDGAVRFPAHLFNLPSKDVLISSDVMAGKVLTI